MNSCCWVCFLGFFFFWTGWNLFKSIKWWKIVFVSLYLLESNLDIVGTVFILLILRFIGYINRFRVSRQRSRDHNRKRIYVYVPHCKITAIKVTRNDRCTVFVVHWVIKNKPRIPTGAVNTMQRLTTRTEVLSEWRKTWMNKARGCELLQGNTQGNMCIVFCQGRNQ